MKNDISVVSTWDRVPKQYDGETPVPEMLYPFNYDIDVDSIDFNKCHSAWTEAIMKANKTWRYPKYPPRFKKIRWRVMWLRYDLRMVKFWIKDKIKSQSQGTLYLSDDKMELKKVAIVRNWRFKK